MTITCTTPTSYDLSQNKVFRLIVTQYLGSSNSGRGEKEIYGRPLIELLLDWLPRGAVKWQLQTEIAIKSFDK
jgi:hypothetical protein